MSNREQRVESVHDLVGDEPAEVGYLVIAEHREELFCRCYVRTLNIAKAGELAGVSRATAYRWMDKPHIAKRIAELLEVRAAECAVTPNEIIEETKNIAHHDPLSIFTVDQLAEMGLTNLDPEARRAISGIEYDALYEYEGTGDERRKVHIGNRIKVRFNNKMQALDLLAKIAGAYQRKGVLDEDETDTPQLTNDQVAAAKIAGILERAEKRKREAVDGELVDDTEGLV